MTRWFLALGCVGLLWPGAASAQWGVGWGDDKDWTTSLSLVRMAHGLDGDFQFGETVGVSTIDAEGVLDLETAQELTGRLDVQGFGGHHLRLGYMPIDFDGQSDLLAAITLFGSTFNTGDRVETDFSFRRYDIAYRFDFQVSNHLRISPIIEVDLLDGEVEIQDVTLGLTVKEDLTTPVPQLGMRIEALPIPRLKLFAEAKGFALRSIGALDDASIYGGEAGLSILLTKHLVLTGRYQLDQYDFAASDVDFDLKRDGFSLDLDLRF